MSDNVEHKFGAAGGFLVGRPHSSGGIKGINKSTDQQLEFEGGEVVITEPAVADATKREFQGEMLTNRQILSKINESGGGVSFADGGQVPSEIYWYGNKYQFGGLMMSDKDIIHEISKCGCTHDEFKKGGIVDYLTITLNENPTTAAELKESLEVALAQDKSKKLIEEIQGDYFDEFVMDNPAELKNYLLAIWVLPKNKRQLFFHEWANEKYLKKLNENPFNFLPEEIRKGKHIKKVNFSPTPSNEGLADIANNFITKDILRPRLSGIYFNLEEECISATNSYIVLYIKEKPHVNESSICLMGSVLKWYKEKVNDNIEKNNDGCWRLDEKHPEVFNVIPKDFKNIISVDAQKLYDYASASENFINPITQELFLAFKREDSIIVNTYNAVLLQTCLKAMLQLGYKEIDLCFSESRNRALVIIPKGNSRKVSHSKVDTDLTLLMPIMNDISVSDMEYMPVYDLDNALPTTYFKASGKVPEGTTYDISLTELDKYPSALKILESMTPAALKKSIKGGCSTNYTLAAKSYSCNYYVYFLDFSQTPYDTYRVNILDKTYYSANQAEKEAFNVVSNYLSGADEISQAIAALEILLISSDKSEKKDIKQAISALELLVGDKKYEDGGVLNVSTKIETPLDIRKAPSAVELVENL